MVGLSSEQRRILMEKVADTGNLALGALALGQFLGDRPFSPLLAAGGLAGWLGFLGVAILLDRGRRSDRR